MTLTAATIDALGVPKPDSARVDRVLTDRLMTSNAVLRFFSLTLWLVFALAYWGVAPWWMIALPLGLHITLPKGWKTYWRSPGDAGLPARIDWSGSSNLADAEIRWPIPERFSLFGLETFGFEREVVLPIAEIGRAHV